MSLGAFLVVPYIIQSMTRGKITADITQPFLAPVFTSKVVLLSPTAQLKFL